MAGPLVPQEFLKAENVGLRMLLEQANIDAKTLLVQAGIVRGRMGAGPHGGRGRAASGAGPHEGRMRAA